MFILKYDNYMIMVNGLFWIIKWNIYVNLREIGVYIDW